MVEFEPVIAGSVPGILKHFPEPEKKLNSKSIELRAGPEGQEDTAKSRLERMCVPRGTGLVLPVSRLLNFIFFFNSYTQNKDHFHSNACLVVIS